ncbi:MAG: mandelate racemase/muconate lactonizing enzyme family protein [Candidatus Limnocylindrales bacterium]
MRIADVFALGLSGVTPKGGWSEELEADDSVHTLIAVATDEGMLGFGSVFSSVSLVRGALEILRPLLIGEDALEPQRVAEVLDRQTFWMGRGGAVTQTISGIDIALWDILGRSSGQPIGRLLGGRYRDRVRPYASVLMDEPRILADRLRALHAQRFRAFKIGWGPFGRVSAAMDEAIVAAAREAVGPDSLLMVDAGASDGRWANGLSWAVRAARMLDEYDVAWFEEPLRPDAMDDHARLRARSHVAIAGGEVLTRRQSFTPWLAAGALDIVQPDVTKCGGISTVRDIETFARAHGVKLVPHGWNTAIGLAVDLQLASAFPETDLVEYIQGSPYVDELQLGGWRLDEDGMLDIPSVPGIGFRLDLDALARFTGGAVPEPLKPLLSAMEAP